MAVRTSRIEIFGFAKERREAWKELAIACQRMTNRLWQIWLCHHVNNGSADKLRKHFEEFREWEKTKVGDKPKWPLKVVDEPLTKSSDSRSFYRMLSAEFPSVNVRTRGLLTNAWQSKLGQRKSASGSLPGWVAILFANESLPSFTRPQPIPFDHDNAKLYREGDNYFVDLRIERLADSGKSVVEKCQLMVNKRKCLSVRRIMDRIIDGEYAWKGSNLLFDRGKWYVSIAFELPPKQHVALNPDKVLFVRPGFKTPWRVMINSGSWKFGGNGLHVEYARRAIINERSSRHEHRRFGGSTLKGHGRRREMAIFTKLSSRWRDFVKRYNNEITRQLINLAVSRGCGRIVYLQPKDAQRDSRCLSRIGNTDRSGMLWDYFQFGSMLASKCETEGIEYGAKPKKKGTKAAADNLPGVRKTGQPNRGKRSA